MRFLVFILALIASDVACAQTPLPRSRPAGAAARVMASPSVDVNAVVKIPLPRKRPSAMVFSPVSAPRVATEQSLTEKTATPVAQQAAILPPEPSPATGVTARVIGVTPEQAPAPAAVETPLEDTPSTTVAETLADKPAAEPATTTETAVQPDPPKASEQSAPMTRFKPEQAIRRAARAEAQYRAASKEDPAVAAEISAEVANAAGREPQAEGNDSVDDGMPAAKGDEKAEASDKTEADEKTESAEAAPEPTAPETRLLRKGQTKIESAGPAKAPSSKSTAADAPMVTVSPGEADRLDKLDAQRQQTLEALKSGGPAAATITPSELQQLAQMQQGVPALQTLFKKVPQPKKRPLGAWPRPDDIVFRDVNAKTPDEECDAVVNSGIIVAERLPALGRWGACYVPHAVRVTAINLMGRGRVDIVPPAKLRCGMALAVANWVRGEVAPAAVSLGAKFVGIRQLDSYNCRTMSSSKRVMSEHSAGNALDVAELMLANHDSAPLYSRSTQKALRSKLRATACARFKTVLGPGVPQHHDHIHIDLRKHFSGNGICHWNL